MEPDVKVKAADALETTVKAGGRQAAEEVAM